MAILFLMKMLQFLAFYGVRGFFYVAKTPQIPVCASQWHSTQSRSAEAYHAPGWTAHPIAFHWNIVLLGK